jgi:putative two-component system response regulator
MTDNGKPKILIVDDMEINRIILEEILAENYEIEQAEDGMQAISTLLNSVVKPTLILLDIMMPKMDGFEALRIIKSSPVLDRIPVIFITAADSELKGLSSGAVDYISKPFEPEIVKMRVANHIELSLYREKLEALVEKKAYELDATKERFLETMAELIEYRSLESGQHVKRTKELARVLIGQMLKKNGVYRRELGAENIEAIIKAVPLHDIGKVGIPDNILLKPGKLTPEEFEQIKTHTVIGSMAIQSLMIDDGDDYLRHCYNICRFHHEKWNGSGYPEGRAGVDIPLPARIVALIDVYDALTSKRCYKEPMSHETATEIIKESSGSHFDAHIVNAYLEAEKKFDETRELFAEIEEQEETNKAL